MPWKLSWKKIRERFAKPIFIALGFLAFGLGTVGIFLPVLPTTPLYLLAAFCFARGSARFHRWFVSTGLYKKHLEGFVKSRAMTMKAKLAICVPVTLMLAAAMWLAPIWHARALIAAALLFKWYYFLFRIRTLPKMAPGEAPRETPGEAPEKSPGSAPADASGRASWKAPGKSPAEAGIIDEMPAGEGSE
ncbi:MAG: YbaN family protein [Clostridiales bacterium]|jgi:uncharacterized membrane protein YbaN (DUF454 family)|nr:YbaN family protein [Clostridiales bacterium]